MSQKYL